MRNTRTLHISTTATAAIAALMIGAIPAASANFGSNDIRGIYVDSIALPLQPPDEQALSAALKVPSVDGLTLVLGWDAIEPGAGVYAWTQSSSPQWLDRWIGEAIRDGKKVELSLRADKTPLWLPSAGVKTLSFIYAPQAGAKTCQPETVAVPWDTGFLTQWDAMLAALSAHLKATTVNGVREYDAVALLRLTGINRNSDELHLPSELGDKNGNGCDRGNNDIWQKNGYTAKLLLSGWDSITSSFKKHFPEKIFSVAIIDGTHPFPPLDDNGNPITKLHGLSVEQNQPLLALAARKFPGRLVIQNNSLYENLPAQAETIDFGQSLGTMIAFQTNLVGGPSGGAACTKRNAGGGACASPQDYLRLLETGIYPSGQSARLRAQYIEVFAPNVNAFPDAILQAHNELTADPAPHQCATPITCCAMNGGNWSNGRCY